MNNLAFVIKMNCFNKKLNGFFMYKEILSGSKLLWNVNDLLVLQPAALPLPP